jgi:hypothetical protein
MKLNIKNYNNFNYNGMKKDGRNIKKHENTLAEKGTTK